MSSIWERILQPSKRWRRRGKNRPVRHLRKLSHQPLENRTLLAGNPFPSGPANVDISEHLVRSEFDLYEFQAAQYSTLTLTVDDDAAPDSPIKARVFDGAGNAVSQLINLTDAHGYPIYFVEDGTYYLAQSKALTQESALRLFPEFARQEGDPADANRFAFDWLENADYQPVDPAGSTQFRDFSPSGSQSQGIARAIVYGDQVAVMDHLVRPSNWGPEDYTFSLEMEQPRFLSAEDKATIHGQLYHGADQDAGCFSRMEVPEHYLCGYNIEYDTYRFEADPGESLYISADATTGQSLSLSLFNDQGEIVGTHFYPDDLNPDDPTPTYETRCLEPDNEDCDLGNVALSHNFVEGGTYFVGVAPGLTSYDLNVGHSSVTRHLDFLTGPPSEKTSRDYDISFDFDQTLQQLPLTNHEYSLQGVAEARGFDLYSFEVSASTPLQAHIETQRDHPQLKLWRLPEDVNAYDFNRSIGSDPADGPTFVIDDTAYHGAARIQGMSELETVLLEAGTYVLGVASYDAWIGEPGTTRFADFDPSVPFGRYSAEHKKLAVAEADMEYSLELTIGQPGPRVSVTFENLPSGDGLTFTDDVVIQGYDDGTADFRLYEFNADGGDLLVARTRLNQVGNMVDTYLRLFDANRQPLAASDSNLRDQGFAALAHTIQRGGTYYLGVSGADNIAYGITDADYRGVIDSDLAKGQATTGEFELEITLSPIYDATTVSSFPYDIRGSFSDADESLVFKISAEVGDILRIESQGLEWQDPAFVNAAVVQRLPTFKGEPLSIIPSIEHLLEIRKGNGLLLPNLFGELGFDPFRREYVFSKDETVFVIIESDYRADSIGGFAFRLNLNQREKVSPEDEFEVIHRGTYEATHPYERFVTSYRPGQKVNTEESTDPLRLRRTESTGSRELTHEWNFEEDIYTASSIGSEVWSFTVEGGTDVLELEGILGDDPGELAGMRILNRREGDSATTTWYLTESEPGPEPPPIADTIRTVITHGDRTVTRNYMREQNCPPQPEETTGDHQEHDLSEHGLCIVRYVVEEDGEEVEARVINEAGIQTYISERGEWPQGQDIRIYRFLKHLEDRGVLSDDEGYLLRVTDRTAGQRVTYRYLDSPQEVDGAIISRVMVNFEIFSESQARWTAPPCDYVRECSSAVPIVDQPVDEAVPAPTSITIQPGQFHYIFDSGAFLHPWSFLLMPALIEAANALDIEATVGLGYSLSGNIGPFQASGSIGMWATTETEAGFGENGSYLAIEGGFSGAKLIAPSLGISLDYVITVVFDAPDVFKDVAGSLVLLNFSAGPWQFGVSLLYNIDDTDGFRAIGFTLSVGVGKTFKGGPSKASPDQASNDPGRIVRVISGAFKSFDAGVGFTGIFQDTPVSSPATQESNSAHRAAQVIPEHARSLNTLLAVDPPVHGLIGQVFSTDRSIDDVGNGADGGLLSEMPLQTIVVRDEDRIDYRSVEDFRLGDPDRRVDGFSQLGTETQFQTLFLGDLNIPAGATQIEFRSDASDSTAFYVDWNGNGTFESTSDEGATVRDERVVGPVVLNADETGKSYAFAMADEHDAGSARLAPTINLFDGLGPQLLQPGQMNGLFTVHARDVANKSPILVVNSTSDEDDGDVTNATMTLREAIALANTIPGLNIIRFDLPAGPQVVVLDGRELRVIDDLELRGPGADLLTIDAQQNSRVFNIDDGLFNSDNMINVTLVGLTIRGGQVHADLGGGLRNIENLILDGVVLSGNSTTGDSADGGAVYNLGNLIVNDSTIVDNFTSGERAEGAGIAHRFGELHVNNSTVSQNFTLGGSALGGGIHSRNGEVTISHSSISNNHVSGDNAHGGGIFSDVGNRLLVSESAVAGNTASGGSAQGGGIYAERLSEIVTQGSSFADNTSPIRGGGGLFSRAAIVQISDTLFANNSGGDLARPSEDHSPIVVNPIEDVTLDEGAPNQIIDLSHVFSDLHTDSQSLSVSSSDDSHVAATLQGTDLILSFVTHRCGTTTVTMTVEAGELQVSDQFDVETRVAVHRFVVNSMGDGGDVNPGDCVAQDAAGNTTLRAAIEEANALENLAAGPDVITFDITGSGPHTISPLSPLPTITDTVVIDATSEPDFAGTPIVEIDGSGVMAPANGLYLQGAGSSGSTVRGLAINGFNATGVSLSSAAIRIEASSGGHTISGNYLGLDTDGSTAAGNRFGLHVSSANNTIEGNVISSNNRGILLNGGGADNNTVRANLIGTNAGGNASRGNNTDGVKIRGGSDNTIGGPTEADANTISANFTGVAVIGGSANNNTIQHNLIGTKSTGDGNRGNYVGINLTGTPGTTIKDNVVAGSKRQGIRVTKSDTTGTLIEHNLIGLDVTGMVAIPTKYDGIQVSNSPGNTIRGNVIANSGFNGIRMLNAFTTGNIVQGNLIGTALDGTTPMGNLLAGILIKNASSNQIGGTEPGEGNTISANGEHGILIERSGANGNVIEGNQIGTDAAGAAALGNGSHGIQVDDGTENVIGGTAAGAGNVIGGNLIAGIAVTGGSVTIQGNFIGTNAGGTLDLGNASDGVIVNGGAAMIGGAGTGAGNVIARNGNNGVKINSGTGNAIRRNSIHNNAALGIDLRPNGPTLNDESDADTGANNLQNTLVISTVLWTVDVLLIGSYVDSVPGNSTFPLTIEFFVADDGEGRTFLGTSQLTMGKVLQNTVIPAGPAVVGSKIVATVTDANGNTSEFSVPALVSPTSQLLAAGGEASLGATNKSQELGNDELAPIVDAAVLRLTDLGLDESFLSDIEVTIADLPGPMLALSGANSITIDINAAGHGWFIDKTPRDDVEFTLPGGHSQIAAGSMDLLTVVIHELGHVADLPDLYDVDDTEDLMYGWLEAGVRKTSLEASLADEAFAVL